MQVLCCGTRRWNDPTPIKMWLEQLSTTGQPVTILVGDNRSPQPKGIIGADFFILSIAEQLGYDVKVYPALWQTFGRAAGPIRNKQMIDRKPDLVIAFRCKGESFGTDNVIDMALKKRIPVIVVEEDGTHKNLHYQDQAEQLSMFPSQTNIQEEHYEEWLDRILNGPL